MKTLACLEGGLVRYKMKQSFIPEFFLQSKQETDVSLQKRRNLSNLPQQKSLKLEDIPLKQPILKVPTNKLPSLSPETLSVLSSLNLSKSTRSSEEILNSVRPREKYSELLEVGRKLALPYKYRRLLQMQEYLDCSINTAKKRGYPHDFNTLKENIEATYESFINLQHLGQIKALVPELYKFSFSGKSLVVDFSDEQVFGISELHARNSQVKRKMLQIVKGFHKEHLKTLQIAFDPDSCKTWHSSFDLHQVPDLSSASFDELEKEEGENMKKLGNIENKARFTRLLSFCALILKVFKKVKTPSLFLKSLVKRITAKKKENQGENNIDEKIIVHDLTEISQILPDWITIIKTDSGPVVRCSRSSLYSLGQIQSSLQSKYQS